MQTRTKRLMRMVLAPFRDQPRCADAVKVLLQKIEQATTPEQLQQIADEVLVVVPPEVKREFPLQVAFCTTAVGIVTEEEWEAAAQTLHDALSS